MEESTKAVNSIHEVAAWPFFKCKQCEKTWQNTKEVIFSLAYSEDCYACCRKTYLELLGKDLKGLLQRLRKTKN